ncbi:MAG: glycosyltransferase family 2 protein [Planctomycetes bacterium]|nr:glycosyltransferase family 2 protein [Planctomycetota bacterium]
MNPTIRAILVHYGDARITQESIEALRRSQGVSLGLTVVDNGSWADVALLLEPAVAAAAASLPAGARLLRPGKNLGFAGGLNCGVAELSAGDLPRYFFFLNHDVAVSQEAIRLLADLLEREPRAAAAGPAILFHGTEDRVWNAGSDLEWPQARPRSRYHGRPASELPAEPFPAGYLCGCAILMSAEKLARLGRFPEDYFLYYEDADWGERIRRAGWLSLVEPRARVWHRPGSAAGREKDLVAYYQIRNRLLFSKRWGPRTWSVRAARAWFFLRKICRGGPEAAGARAGWAGK